MPRKQVESQHKTSRLNVYMCQYLSAHITYLQYMASCHDVYRSSW